MNVSKIFYAIVLSTVLLGFHVAAQNSVAENLDSCIDPNEFDPSVDYFPEKVEFAQAENVSVEYFNNYKVVTVVDAFDGAEPFQYVLVQCGTPAPDMSEFDDSVQIVDVPVERFIALSTTQLPHLIDLEHLDVLIGLDSFLFVNSEPVVELIEAGELIEVSSGADINVEVVLDAEPDVVMAFGFNPDTDAHPVLREAGIFTAMNAEWREDSPLARAEWIKYVALFLNAEQASSERYDEITTAYEQAHELVAVIPEDERKRVLWNYFSPYSDSWTIPGKETYVGQLIEDAGGVVVLGDQAQENSVDVSFEAVYEAGLDADLWVTNAFGVNTLDDLLAQDTRYTDFAAVSAGSSNVWNNNLQINENGGNNYYELGVTNPHLILQDLAALFYPELFPDHEFVFYRNLSKG